MVHFIVVILSMGLFGLLLLAQLNYMPAWTKTVDADYTVTKEGLDRFESAYNLYAQANSGVGPSTAGGAIPETLRPYLRFIPAAPRGTVWSYGQNGADGTLYANMHYFCATPNTANGITEGVYRGFLRASSVLSPEQFFISSACNNRTAATGYASNTSATLYVAFSPASLP